ncbi:MAG: hypothetical protein ACTH31_11475 [Pseudoclavibacter sp.]
MRRSSSADAPRPGRSRDRALYVETLIDAPLDEVWRLTQDPLLHPRWDARFTAIIPTRVRDDGAQEFRYELDLGLHTIRGTGVSLGERRAAGGQRTSALLFDTDDRLSPLGTVLDRIITRRSRGADRTAPHDLTKTHPPEVKRAFPKLTVRSWL